MSMKNKKVLWFALGGLDVALTGFLFVIHILMLSHIVGKTPEAVQAYAQGAGLIPYLIRNLTVYLVAFVIPLFLILAANIVVLVIYLRKKGKDEQVKISDLSEEEKEKLRKELLEELSDKK